MQPKEDPEAKKLRKQQRRMAEIEQREAAQGTAADLQTDLRAVYGLPSMFSRNK